MLYAAKHPDSLVPARLMYVSIFIRFITTGSVRAQKRMRPNGRTHDFIIDVLAYAAVSSEANVREIASAMEPAKLQLGGHFQAPYHVCRRTKVRPSTVPKWLNFGDLRLLQ